MQMPETFVNQITGAKIVKSFPRDKNTPLALFCPLLHAAQSTFLALFDAVDVDHALTGAALAAVHVMCMCSPLV
jgi:hypothetical protein